MEEVTTPTPDNAARDAVASMMKANAPFGWVKDEPASDGISAFTAREEVANKWRILDCRVVTVYNLPHVAATVTALEAEVAVAQRRLDACLKFIDGIRDDLHNRRTADWFPEGAHDAATSMSEDMRLIGNACADFDPYQDTGAGAK